MEKNMDDEAAVAIDARINALSAAICALVAAMVARGDMEKGLVISTLAAYRDAATKTDADPAGLAEVDRLILAIDAVQLPTGKVT